MASTHYTDGELIRRCLGGNSSEGAQGSSDAGRQGAWDALVHRYSDLIFAIARKSGLDGSLAEDVVQDVFMRLFKNLSRIRNTERIAGWICQTARRESWRVAKRSKNARDHIKAQAEEHAHEGAKMSPLPDDLLATEERRHLVHRALGRLASRCRRLLEALFLREVTDYQELSAEIGMPIGSIGPTRRRCLDKMLVELTSLDFSIGELSGAHAPSQDSSQKNVSGEGVQSSTPVKPSPSSTASSQGGGTLQSHHVGSQRSDAK